MRNSLVILVLTLALAPAACKKATKSSTSGAACPTKPGLCASLRSGKLVSCSVNAVDACPTDNKVGTCQLMPGDPDGTTLVYYKDFVGDPKTDCTETQKGLKGVYTPG